ncbi:polysaccharide biosynthesis tyrosine autokinase [Georgenia muralis]|uniref:non-specific protein-tyrosine kinase n=1 Tax=Georgenia muralis TaxID=154117 RepID=A0A3N4Z5J3_9MICO|nr:polysaccharide biosynthesis tyrosine autokinase [Georgenia muralis]RPF26400.1 capsular exopolysaccharide synthesis family protein [Georgenia muralis]
MQFRDFLAILRSRWITIVLATLVVLGAATAATLSITPMYTASARVFFSAEAPSDDDGRTGGTYVITTSDLSTYLEVLNSPMVMDPIREDLGLQGVPFRVSAEIPGGTPILRITAVAPNPDQAAAVANAVGPQLASVAGRFSVLLASSGQDVETTAITPASPPSSPSSPDITRNLALGLLTGLVIGVGLALVRHGLDTKVRRESDVRALSDRPVLAHVPYDKASREQPLVMENDPHGLHAESVRRLRTNLLFVDVTTRKHSFVVTSALPGEGKTTTTINLAMAMADAGARVLLVDADLRNPSVARTMGLEGAAGLTTILLGRATVDDVVQQWRGTTLSVLPAGQVPPNPSELIASAAMESLFAELAQRHDFILIDSPPVVPVIDAVLLNRLTGGTLMVVAMERTTKKHLASALKSLATVDVKVAGFALNMVPTRGESSYYGYGRRAYGTPPETGPDPDTEVPRPGSATVPPVVAGRDDDGAAGEGTQGTSRTRRSSSAAGARRR